MKTKNWATAVQQASALVALLPASREARQERETAAVALEAQAEALVRQGQTDAAFAKLQALQRAWPNRIGLETRLAGIHSAREAERAFRRRALRGRFRGEGAPAREGVGRARAGCPGRRAGGSVSRRPASVSRACSPSSTRRRPSVRLKPGSKTSYSKGKPFAVSVIVTDDYRVKSVTVMARQEGAAAYQELPAQSTGNDEYTVEITPEFHGNKTVQLYVVAVDFAGHSSRLGTAEQPLRFKKRWLF